MNITITAEQAMKITEALKEASEVLLSIANAATQETKPKPKKPVFQRWRAEKGGSYYFVNDRGDMGRATDDCDRIDKHRYESGNYYETEEKAILARKHQLYTRKLKDAAAQAWLDAGDVIDFGDHDTAKYKESRLTAYTTILGDDLEWYMTYND
jgi:hypothetical protein